MVSLLTPLVISSWVLLSSHSTHSLFPQTLKRDSYVDTGERGARGEGKMFSNQLNCLHSPSPVLGVRAV